MVDEGQPFSFPVPDGQEAEQAQLVMSPEQLEQVETFIILNGIDERGADVLRQTEPEIAIAVIEKGEVAEMSNPSAVLLARIRDTRRALNPGKAGGGKDKGKGKGKWGGAKGYGKDGYGKDGYGKDPYGGGWVGGGANKGGKDMYGGYGGKGWGAPGPADWGPAKGGKSSWGAPVGPVPTIHWIEVGPESQIVQSGMPGQGPCLNYDKTMSVYMSATSMLSDLVGDIAVACVLDHDADWVKYPEVGHAFQAASGEENCFAVASCPEHGVWGVGFGNGYKGQEAAAKVALCVALASGTEFEAVLSQNYPEFRALMSGGKGKGAFGKGAFGKQPPGKQAWAAAPAQGKRALPPFQADPFAAPAEAPMGNGSLPEVHMVTLTQESTITQLGFPPEAPAISHNKAFQEAFSDAHHIVTDLTDGAPLEFHHDTDWDVFPEVAAAIQASGAEQTSFVVASCPPLGRWAIGLGSGWKSRETSGKLALAVALADVSPKTPETIGHYPNFGNLLASVGFAVPPPAKMRKV